MFTYAPLATLAHPSHLGLDDNLVVMYLSFKDFTYALPLKKKLTFSVANKFSPLPTQTLEEPQLFQEYFLYILTLKC